MGKKRVMTKATLEEISLVDRPAQAGAKVTLRKRDEKIEKKYPLESPVLLSDVDGHSHVLDLADGAGGETSYMKSKGAEYGHTHPWIKEIDGKVSIGTAEGHTHDIVSPEGAGLLNKGTDPATPTPHQGGNRQETTMTPEEKAAFEKAAQEKLDAMQKRAERAEKLAELTDGQKASFAKMGKDEQDAFLALAPEAREAEIRKSADANPVICTVDGVEVRKNDDPRLVALAKKADAEAKRANEAEAVTKRERLTKRAEGLTLKGDVDTKIALLEAVEALPTEKRGKVEELLLGAEGAVALALEKRGAADNKTTEGEKPEDALQALAKKFKDADPKLTDAQAYMKAVKSDEGKALYRKHIGV